MDLKPLELDLLILTPSVLSNLDKITSIDIYKQNSTEFHPDGLFSTRIFGEVGSKERMTSFAYVELGIHILHPRLYREFSSLSSLYKGIMDGSRYAIFDDEAKDFIEADRLDGKTGLLFFMNYYNKINILKTNTDKRKAIDKLLKKYTKEQLLMNNYLVIPAGLRDYTVTESGKVLENEINNLYRRLINISNTAVKFKKDLNNEENDYINAIRKRLQKAGLDIYEYIENTIDASGKGKFIQGKWLKRSLLYGTRNVITSIPHEIKDATDPNNPTAISTMVGVFQALKGLLPITLFNLRTKHLSSIFSVETSKAMLINKKTLKKEPVELSEKTRSQWVTDNGLEDTLNKLNNDTIALSPIIVEDHYLLLIYDDGEYIMVVDNIDLLPENIDRKYIRPITYIELLYLTLFNIVSNYPTLITRYPVTGYGSLDPSIPYLKSTLDSRKMKLRVPGSNDTITLPEYPRLDSKLFKSLSIPLIFLDSLDGDYDGPAVVVTA